MSDEESDDHDDHSGGGQRPSAGRGEKTVPADGDGEPGANASGDADEKAYVEPADPVSGEELERALNVIRSASEADLRNAGLIEDPMAIHQQLMQTALMSGPLPPADEFNRYSPECQERMCRWNDSFTIDESHRQDRLVDEEISQAKTGRWLTTFLLVFFGGLSAFLFVRTGDPHSFWLLSVPVASILGNMLQPVFSRSSSHKNNRDQTSDSRK